MNVHTDEGGRAGWLVLAPRFAEIDNRNWAPVCESVVVEITSAYPAEIEVPRLRESPVPSDTAFAVDVHVHLYCHMCAGVLNV